MGRAQRADDLTHSENARTPVLFEYPEARELPPKHSLIFHVL